MCCAVCARGCVKLSMLLCLVAFQKSKCAILVLGSSCLCLCSISLFFFLVCQRIVRLLFVLCCFIYQKDSIAVCWGHHACIVTRLIGISSRSHALFRCEIRCRNLACADLRRQSALLYTQNGTFPRYFFLFYSCCRGKCLAVFIITLCLNEATNQLKLRVHLPTNVFGAFRHFNKRFEMAVLFNPRTIILSFVVKHCYNDSHSKIC